MEDLEEATFLDESGGNIVQLGNTYCGGLSDVGIFITEGTGEWVAEVFGDAIDADASHGPDGQGANERIWITRVLDKRIDGEEREFGLGLGIVDEIKVNELLEFNVSGLDAIKNVREEHGDVFANCHGGNDFFHCVDFGVAICRVELHAKFVHFSLLLGSEESGVMAAIRLSWNGWHGYFLSCLEYSSSVND